MHGGWDDTAGGAGGAGDEPPAGAESPAGAEPPAGAERPAEPGGVERPVEPGGVERPAEPGYVERPTEPGGAEPAVAQEPEPAELPVVLAKLAQIQELADEVMASPVWQHSNPQSVAAVEQSAIAVRKVQAAHLALLADMDGRVGTLPGAPAGYEARTFLRHALHRTMGQAKADLAAAHLLRPDADPAERGLPRLGAAFAAGEVSREHVDAAVRIVQRLPKKLLAVPMYGEDGTPLLDENGKAMCAGDVIDEKITTHARQYDSYALSQLAAQLKETLDPDGSFDPAACIKRGLRMHWDHAGMLVLRGELGPAEGALFESVIDQLANPNRDHGGAEDEDGTRLRVTDHRSIPERQADALMELIESGRATTKSSRGGEPPRITIITRAEDLAAARAASQTTPAPAAGAPSPSSPCDGGSGSAFSPPETARAGDGGTLGTGTHISPSLLALLSCDAILQKALLAPNGAVLNLGRETRTITPAQRRALTARDHGCVIPGCTIPAPWCHGHHVQWWSQNGPTDIANLALVCPRHHTEVHAGIWVLTMRDGVPWAIPPDWIDYRQRPLRNPYPDDLQDMRDLGTQLRLNLGHPPTSGSEQSGSSTPSGAPSPDMRTPSPGSGPGPSGQAPDSGTGTDSPDPENPADPP